MAKYKVNITVEAADIMQAELLGQALQNILTELGEDQAMLLQFSNPGVARQYSIKIRQLANNPLAKKLLQSFG